MRVVLLLSLLGMAGAGPGCNGNAGTPAEPDAVSPADGGSPADGPTTGTPDGGVVDVGPGQPGAPGNAILLSGDTVVPIYPVTGGGGPLAVGYTYDGVTLHAVDEQGQPLWTTSPGSGYLFGGFDFDSDGWPDLGLVRSQGTGELCGTTEMLQTSLDFIQGRTGVLHAPTAPLKDLCWTFGSVTYPTHQWTDLGALFGADTGTLALAPYYATTGWFFDFTGTFVSTSSFLYPSTPQYDATYVNDKPNAFGQGQSYTSNPHVANGMLLTISGQQRLVFFTSARVVQYAVAPLSANQLVMDTPFVARQDLVGRNYGLVLPDPSYPQHLILVSGTSADTLASDMRTSSMAADPWGQIERHVVLYNLATGTVEDRFFSYAHDNNDGDKYEGRIVYPDNPIVRGAPGAPSRIAFNEYAGGHWRLHITQPGSTADETVITDWFLWDIQDVDQDGLEEWVLSPARDPSDPDVPGYYFVKWRTVLSSYVAGMTTISVATQYTGRIPYLAPTFRKPRKTTSRSFLYPVLTARTDQGLELLLMEPGGGLAREPIAP